MASSNASTGEDDDDEAVEEGDDNARQRHKFRRPPALLARKLLFTNPLSEGFRKAEKRRNGIGISTAPRAISSVAIVEAAAAAPAAV